MTAGGDYGKDGGLIETRNSESDDRQDFEKNEKEPFDVPKEAPKRNIDQDVSAEKPDEAHDIEDVDKLCQEFADGSKVIIGKLLDDTLTSPGTSMVGTRPPVDDQAQDQDPQDPVSVGMSPEAYPASNQ